MKIKDGLTIRTTDSEWRLTLNDVGVINGPSGPGYLNHHSRCNPHEHQFKITWFNKGGEVRCQYLISQSVLNIWISKGKVRLDVLAMLAELI